MLYEIQYIWRVKTLSTLLLSLVCCLSINAAYSQSDSLLEQSIAVEQDSTLKSKQFPKQYGPKKWKFMVGLDARRSFFRGTPVKINGIRTGLEYKGVHRFGIGFYGLSKNAIFDNILVDNPAATVPAVAAAPHQPGYKQGAIIYQHQYLQQRQE